MSNDFPQRDEATVKIEQGSHTEKKEENLAYSYYLTADCPDGHIREALRGLICNRLETEKTEDEMVEVNLLLDTVPDLGAQQLRWLIAVNPNTPASVLESLVNVGGPALLERIAENPATSSITLARLAFDPCADVRQAVAENENAAIETVWMLVRDECPDVRFKLAEGYHLPVEVLHVLAEDENPFVAARAITTLQRIERSSGGGDIKTFRSLTTVRKVYNLRG
jgi:hypothetical protein